MISYDVDNIPHHLPPYHQNPQRYSKTAFGFAGLSNISDGSSACSSRSSPQLDSFDSRPNSFNTGFETMALDSDYHSVFSNALDPYMEDSFKFSSCLPRVQSEPDVSPWSDFNQACSAYGTGGPNVYSQPVNHDQGFVSGLTNLTPTSFSKTFRQPFCVYSPVNLSTPTSASSASVNPTTEELNQYCRWLSFQPRHPCSG